MRTVAGVIIVAAIIMTGCSSHDDVVPCMFDESFGVWADADCELVRTGKISILFERHHETMVASLTRLERDGPTVIYDTRAATVFDTAGRTVAVRAKDLIDGDDILVDTDPDNVIELQRRSCAISRDNGRLLILHGDEVCEELRPSQKKLKLKIGGVWHTLERVEKFNVSEAYEMPTATAENVGVCLQEWGLGTGVTRGGDGRCLSLTVNTNRHSYAYHVENMVYCRAARIRSNNKGQVFDQNIRLMSKPGEFTAFMPSDNLAVTREPICIEDSLFDPKACVYSPRGIYWSLKSFSDSLITVNGCGQDYFIRLRDTAADDHLEWIAFSMYCD